MRRHLTKGDPRGPEYAPPASMQHSQIEYDAHNLLDEANVVLLTDRSDPATANDLVEKIRACAAQARESGWPDIAQRLLNVAERVLTKLARRPL